MELQNEWKTIWGKRTVDEKILKTEDKKQIFLELKRSNGFDVLEDGLTYEALEEQKNEMEKWLSGNCFLGGDSRKTQIKSIYEVGCGSGASLFLFEQDGIICGGLDYSEALIESAKKVLQSNDLFCREAIDTPVSPQYDAVLSNSVFSYFKDEEYAYGVLEKMYQKTAYSIGLIDIHDAKKEEAFITYRKTIIPDYEERYKNLPKFFYRKEFFEKFAKDHQMDICFTDSHMKGYWNNEFIFNCYMYKK